jgi:hypothetical protein
MSISMMNPTGVVMQTQLRKVQQLDELRGKRVGYVFNQHATASAFWKKLESGVAAKFSPAGICRVYKDNTWAPAPQADVSRLIQETDYALVGVGA